MKTNVSGLKDSKLRHVFNRCSNLIGGMMVSSWICSASSLKQQSTGRHFSTLTHYSDSKSLLFLLNAAYLARNNKYQFYSMVWPNPMIYRTRTTIFHSIDVMHLYLSWDATIKIMDSAVTWPLQQHKNCSDRHDITELLSTITLFIGNTCTSHSEKFSRWCDPSPSYFSWKTWYNIMWSSCKAH
jgi:hypothetical protein